jgi:hypothetical protein
LRKLSLIALLALMATLVMAVAASARGGDHNGDRIPDRWERTHRLSLKVNQARRDTDRDGLNNRGEWRSHSDPRDRDSDDDGIEDGDENAGTVASFDKGVLTITLAQGGELSATVDDDTEIECHTRADLRHHTHRSSAGDDHNGGSGDGEHGDEEEHTAEEHPAEEHGDEEHGDDGDDSNEHGDDDDDRCGADQLKAGTVVHEAELKVTSKGKHWEELELVPAV